MENNNEIDIEKAFRIIERVCADFNGKLKDHYAIQQSLDFIKKKIAEVDAKSEQKGKSV